jgi:hypothetical protein
MERTVLLSIPSWYYSVDRLETSHERFQLVSGQKKKTLEVGSWMVREVPYYLDNIERVLVPERV